MDSKTFNVPGISCGHCVMTIERELSELSGVKKVKADQVTKNVVVEWDNPATLDTIKHLLQEINYPAVEA
jgi:copper ion binding protein